MYTPNSSGTGYSSRVAYHATGREFYSPSKFIYERASEYSHKPLYTSTSKKKDESKKEQETRFTPQIFIKRNYEVKQFIGRAEQVQPFVEQCYSIITEQNLPNNILIQVLPQQLFEETHEQFGSQCDSSVLGFAINKNPYGLSEVYVRQSDLASVMVTLGHELGHVLSNKLSSPQAEEAKAFAFTLEWVKIIAMHNIADIGEAMQIPEPAKNNVHDAAFEWVLEKVKNGNKPMEIYRELIKKHVN